MILKTASPTFFCPVTLKQLDEKGALRELKFDAQFKRIKQSEFDALMRSNKAKAEQRQAYVAAGVDISEQLEADVSAIFDNYMTGWSGIQDEGKNNLPYNRASLDELCEQNTGMQVAIIQAFYGSFSPSAAAHLAAKN